jgi:hypothetical protein
MKSAKKSKSKSESKPKSEINVELLLAVKEAILAKPETYDQGHFCNSAFCTAGHAVAIARPRIWKKAHKMVAPGPGSDVLSQRYLDWREGQELVEQTARELLKIPAGLTFDLFSSGWRWPDKLFVRLEQARTPKQRARAGAKAIDDFIKTDGWRD